MNKYLFKIECIIGKDCNEVINKLNNLGIPYDLSHLSNYKGWKINAYVVKPEIEPTRRLLLQHGAIIIK